MIVEPLFEIPEDLEALSHEDLTTFVAAAQEVAARIASGDVEFIGDRSPEQVITEMTAGVVAIEQARNLLAVMSEEEAAVQAQIAELATRAGTVETLSEAEPEEEAPPVEEEEEEADPEEEAPVEAEAVAEPVVAAAPRPALPRPSRARQAAPQDTKRPALTACAEGLGYALGTEFEDEMALAAAMIRKRDSFGHMSSSEKVPVGRIDWRDQYPSDRRLRPEMTTDQVMGRINELVASIQSDQNKGTDKALVASGGICAPVTPYYNLQMISVADRPLRASFPAFVADRGGIRFAAPPKLSAVTTAVGVKTAAQDATGGTTAAKTCQTLVCPSFSEVDVAIIYHCVQTSNLTYRTFPEQLAQFNNLVLAAHARSAETVLLDALTTASTQVTAANINLGASGALLTEILTAAAGIRSRHRMNADAVLRVVLPRWSVALMISDVIRTQFARFDTDEAQLTALLRSFGIEPTFHIDGPTGGGQIFGAQGATSLIPFPPTVKWFIFPEGSFLYLDGGTLELGLVRDSVLNNTNEFQIFGESFENLAFVGVESLEITSIVCDSGKVADRQALTCGNYGAS